MFARERRLFREKTENQEKTPRVRAGDERTSHVESMVYSIELKRLCVTINLI